MLGTFENKGFHKAFLTHFSGVAVTLPTSETWYPNNTTSSWYFMENYLNGIQQFCLQIYMKYINSGAIYCQKTRILNNAYPGGLRVFLKEIYSLLQSIYFFITQECKDISNIRWLLLFL